jgi:hypothetical protein
VGPSYESGVGRARFVHTLPFLLGVAAPSFSAPPPDLDLAPSPPSMAVVRSRFSSHLISLFLYRWWQRAW